MRTNSRTRSSQVRVKFVPGTGGRIGPTGTLTEQHPPREEVRINCALKTGRIVASQAAHVLSAAVFSN